MADAARLGGGSVTLDDGAFGAAFNMPLVHESVRAELNARRQGTASTKTRGEVRGGGAKPWRQKGTGRARAGSSRSPIWTGGGVVFGPQPRGYVFKVNRKARRAALRSALSVHAGRGSLAVFDASVFDAPSTSRAVDLLDDWSQDVPTLVLLGADEAFAGKSFRNIARVRVMPVEEAGVADVIGAASLLVSDVALPDLVARATGTASPVEAPRSVESASTAKRRSTRGASTEAAPPATDTSEEPVVEATTSTSSEEVEQEPEAVVEDSEAVVEEPESVVEDAPDSEEAE
jgi:large subunit ribosomal protein L4